MTALTTPSDALAILTAAGSGTRLGDLGPKALVPVAGVSMLERAARGLVDAGIRAIVVTAHRDAIPAFQDAVAGITGATIIIAEGGVASRQESVLRGLDALPAAASEAGIGPGPGIDALTPVLIHDAARCLTPPDMIGRVVDAVRAGHPAVIPALAVTDTIVDVEPPAEGGAGAALVNKSLDRTRLRAVQTPQGFEWGWIRRAHDAGAARAGNESTAATDDASLVQAIGGQVAVVDGDEMAFKITTPLDLALAETLAGR